MLRGFARPALAVYALAAACVPALGQSFILDLDIGGGDPGIGAGAPSDGFGAAANQPGRWNRFNVGLRDPVPVLGLNGAATGVTYQLASTTVGGVGFAFLGNTGDPALLLNDAAYAGSSGQGGRLTYNFSGFTAGSYDVYTYAVHVGGLAISVPVTVPEAVAEQTQVVTGPMPGNSLLLTVTHSRHRVNLIGGGVFHVDVIQPGGLPAGSVYCVNGFQVRAVPEPAAILPLIGFLGILLLASKKAAK